MVFDLKEVVMAVAKSFRDLDVYRLALKQAKRILR
jgi:hypothetical protein